MTHLKRICIGLFVVTLLNGCSMFGDEDVVKKSPLPTIENEFNPEKVWSESVGGGVDDYYSNLKPAYHNGVIYAADRNGTVKAISADQGKSLWKVNLAERSLLSSEPALLSGGVTIDGDKLYIGSEKAQMYALNAQDGSLIWQVRVAGEVLSYPAVSDEMVLVSTSNGFLQSLDQATGTVNWTINLETQPLSIRGESSPVVAHGAVIVGSNTGRVSAILLNGGRLIWQQRIAKPGGATEISRLSDVDVTPVIDDDIAYVIAYNGSLAAIDLRSGQVLWRRDLGTAKDFILNNGVIYLVDASDTVVALERTNGSIIWTQNGLLYRDLTPPVVYQNSLVVGDSDGYLHWLDIKDGRFVAQEKVSGSGLFSAPQVVDGRLVVQARNGTVYAYSH